VIKKIYTVPFAVDYIHLNKQWPEFESYGLSGESVLVFSKNQYVEMGVYMDHNETLSDPLFEEILAKEIKNRDLL